MAELRFRPWQSGCRCHPLHCHPVAECLQVGDGGQHSPAYPFRRHILLTSEKQDQNTQCRGWGRIVRTDPQAADLFVLALALPESDGSRYLGPHLTTPRPSQAHWVGFLRGAGPAAAWCTPAPEESVCPRLAGASPASPLSACSDH